MGRGGAEWERVVLRSGGHALIAPPAAPGTNAMGHRRTRALSRPCRAPRGVSLLGFTPELLPPTPQPRGHPEATSLLYLNLPQANSGSHSQSRDHGEANSERRSISRSVSLLDGSESI